MSRFHKKTPCPTRKQRNFRVRIRIPVCLDNTANLSEVLNVVTQTKHVQKRTSKCNNKKTRIKCESQAEGQGVRCQG